MFWALSHIWCYKDWQFNSVAILKPELSYCTHSESSRVDGLRLMDLVSLGLKHHLEVGAVTINFSQMLQPRYFGNMEKEKMSYVLVSTVYHCFTESVLLLFGRHLPIPNPDLKMNICWGICPSQGHFGWYLEPNPEGSITSSMSVLWLQVSYMCHKAHLLHQERTHLCWASASQCCASHSVLCQTLLCFSPEDMAGCWLQQYWPAVRLFREGGS